MNAPVHGSRSLLSATGQEQYKVMYIVFFAGWEEWEGWEKKVGHRSRGPEVGQAFDVLRFKSHVSI